MKFAYATFKWQSGIFLKNNYKSEAMLLVRQRFKLFLFLTIRVQMTRFCHLKMHLKIECETLELKMYLEIECETLVFQTRMSHTRFPSAFSNGKIESFELELLETNIV